jgi:hypothetical protein
MIGPLVRGPTSGGWELGGTACTYVGHEGLVISVAIVSTAAFDLERHDPQSVTISTDGMSAYAARRGPLGDVRLFSRSFKSAVIVHVSGGSKSNEKRLDLANQFARTALECLDAAQELSALHEPRHDQPKHSLFGTSKFAGSLSCAGRRQRDAHDTLTRQPLYDV